MEQFNNKKQAKLKYKTVLNLRECCLMICHEIWIVSLAVCDSFESQFKHSVIFIYKGICAPMITLKSSTRVLTQKS